MFKKSLFGLLLVLCSFVPATAQSGTQTLTYAPTLSFSSSYATGMVTLTGNVTSFTIPNGTAGQQFNLDFCQDTVGGRFIQSGPSNYSGTIAINPLASYCTTISTAWINGKWVANKVTSILPPASGGTGASAFNQLTGTATPAQLPAATPSTQGAVILPSGAANNTLGSASITSSTAYDAAGAAAAVLAPAEAYSANASNLTSGTVPSARLPIATSSIAGVVTCGTGVTCTGGAINASGASSFSQLSGTATSTQLPAATPSTQGAVILPAGAGSNTLGTAAAQPVTAFDAAGVATTAITTAETYSANAGNISSGTLGAARLPAATTSVQGAVVLPTGAGSNVLGTASITSSSAYDAAGAATTAITTAETYSSNAGNLTSGTVANSRLAGTGIVTVNTIPCTLGSTCTIATGATPPATGLLAQYLLIDCTFSNGGTCPDTSGNGNNAVIAGSAVTNGGWGAYLNPGNPYTGLGTPQYINLPTADSTGNLYIINFQIPPGIQNSGTTYYQPQWNGSMTIMGSQGSSGTDNAIMGGGSVNGGAYPLSEGGFAEEMLYGGATSWKNVTVLAHGGVMTLAIYTGAPNRIWVNGVEQTYSSQNGSALPQIPTFWSLGGYHGAGIPSQYMFQGIIGMALVYNTTTTTTALDGLVKQATAYINTTVSQRPNYPVYAPAQNSVSNLVWIGDSIGAGYGAGGTTIQQYLALNNTYTLANNSLSSVTARTMNPLFQDRNLSYIGNGGTTPSKCVIAVGTNDVTEGRSSNQIFSDLISMGQQCHRAGGQSILVSQLDRGSYSSQIESLNTMERQNWRASGAFDMLADVNEIPLLGASGASSNGTYFAGDKTHPTTAGQQLYAPAVSNAINYMDGSSESAPNVVNASIGVIPTLAGGATNYSFILPTPLQAGSISSISFQTYTATTSPITFGLATGSGTSYTIVPGSTFTITPGGTTSLQTFTAGTGFTAPMAATAGEFIAIWGSTALPGYGNSTVGYYYLPSTSLPSGAKTYSFDGAHALAVTVTIPSVTYAMSPADKYVQLMSSDTGVTLPPCSGLTGSIFTIFAPSSTTVNNSSDAAAAIAGSTTISANTTAKFIVNLYGGATAVGCNYIRIQ